MSIIDNLKEDLTKDAKIAEAKLQTSEGRKWVKYAVFAVVGIIILSIGSCMIRGCSPKQQAIVQPQTVQPQVVQQQGSGISVGGVAATVGAGALGYYIGQKMANGQVYDGHNAYTPPAQTVATPQPTAKPVQPVVATPAPVTKNVLTPEQAKVKADTDKSVAEYKAKQKAIEDRKASIVSQRSVQAKSNFKSSVTSRRKK